ncbi:MAG: Asp-tRNA(Asn)/Glu-tRNA(Gln) amidotransferase subunit GatB [bacterium]|nr:Asp-tRNA(Asn)/Glu-tRNA(Gln) amidotransferase subunit GatB [bacterium]
MKYEAVIGLEVHAELKTQTKMFCGCLNNPEDEKPNVDVCPICLAHPGAMPVANQEAIKSVLKLGLAVGGQIAEESHFDRKSYFYPDLPKGYQISQYDNPLVADGNLLGVKIRRVHLEEDTGRLLHEGPSTGSGQSASLIDYNRAGVPLMELVTEPDIRSAEQAAAFAKELQLILRYLGISYADMEKGQMRVEANISLRPVGQEELGTKVEVKNLNSFRSVFDAINYELKRQEEVLETGGQLEQETRGWDENAKKSKSQRSKESAHDYRYFPEPDLPVFSLKNLLAEIKKEGLPELPAVKRENLQRIYGLDEKSAEVLVFDQAAGKYFETAAAELKRISPKTNYQVLVNYFNSDLRGLMTEKKLNLSDLKIKSEDFADFVARIEKGELSSRLAKDLLVKMLETGEKPEILIEKSGMKLMGGEDELLPIIKEIMEKNPTAVADYKSGKMPALQFLFGQAMAKTKGQADPAKLRSILEKELAG